MELDMPVPPELTLRYANTPNAQWEAEQVALDYFEVGLEAVGVGFAGDDVELCRILKRLSGPGMYDSDLIPRDDFDNLLDAARKLGEWKGGAIPDDLLFGLHEAIAEAEAAARLVDRKAGDA